MSDEGMARLEKVLTGRFDRLDERLENHFKRDEERFDSIHDDISELKKLPAQSATPKSDSTPPDAIAIKLPKQVVIAALLALAAGGGSVKLVEAVLKAAGQ
jgi:hypothetical protein